MKMSYASLRAAVALVDPAVTWWEGTIKDTTDLARGPVEYVIAVCPEATKTIDALVKMGFYERHATSSYGTLVAIEAAQLDLDLPTRVTHVFDPDEDHAEFKNMIVRALVAHGAQTFTMEYSGSGDSGNPDHFSASKASTYWHPGHNNNNDFWTLVAGQQHISMPDEFTQAVSDYVWEKLVQHDVVNNDGGGGQFTADITTPVPEFTFSCYTNETITHQHEDGPI